MPLLFFGGAALLASSGYFIDKTGEAVGDTADGLTKLILIGGAAYFIAKKSGVLK